MRSAVYLIVAITLNVALGMSFRHRRQSSDSDDDNNLDDRYGWDRPRPWGDRPWIRPQPNQGNQFPNQGGNQFPQPNQGGNQFPQPNQGGNQFPQPNQGNNNGQQTPVPNGTGSTAVPDPVQECIRNCPVTSEYNPVCGTNMVQYPNPGRLTCAQGCGVNVSLFRASTCPVTTTPAGLI